MFKMEEKYRFSMLSKETEDILKNKQIKILGIKNIMSEMTNALKITGSRLDTEGKTFNLVNLKTKKRKYQTWSLKEKKEKKV